MNPKSDPRPFLLLEGGGSGGGGDGDEVIPCQNKIKKSVSD